MTVCKKLKRLKEINKCLDQLYISKILGYRYIWYPYTCIMLHHIYFQNKLYQNYGMSISFITIRKSLTKPLKFVQINMLLK